DATDLLRVAVRLEAEQGATMRAPIFESGEAAVEIAGDDHRRFADERGDVVAGGRELSLETEEVPGPALEDRCLLALSEALVVVEPVGNAGHTFGPFAVGLQHRRVTPARSRRPG